MKIEILIKELNGKQKEIQEYARTTFPRKASKVAVDHFKENFTKGGFVNGGTTKWKEAKRQRKKTKYTNSQYKTLLSGRNNLYQSIRGTVEDGKAVILTDVEYAAIHNYGGEITHPISRKQRVKAYETHIRKTGTKHREKNSMWRGLALTRKTSYVIKMPQRQFIGHSQELNEKLRKTVEDDILKIINQ